MADDLNVLFPVPAMVAVKGEEIHLMPFTFGQLPKAIQLLAPITRALAASGVNATDGISGQLSGWVDLLANAGEDVLALLAWGIKKERSWFDDMSTEDGVVLLRAFVEVNADFFVRKLLPLVGGSQAQAQDGETLPQS